MNVETHIAHFLKENNYLETLRVFEREFGKPFSDSPDESLEGIIQDRYNFNAINNQLKNLTVNDSLDDDLQKILQSNITEWQVPYPKAPKLVIDSLKGLVISSCVEFWKETPILFLGTSDMKLYAINLSSNEIILELPNFIGKVVVKSITSLGDCRLVLLGMNGKLYLCKYDYSDNLTIQNTHDIQAHPRVVVETRSITLNGETYICTMGWDLMMRIFKAGTEITPIAQYKLPVQGTCFDATVYAGKVVLVVGLTETTLLSVLTLNKNDLDLLYKISLNDAQFTVSSFSPRHLSIQSLALGPPLVAVATSHEPYVRLIIVPLRSSSSAITSVPIERNQILRNLPTLTPQDRYSQPVICWKAPVNAKHNGVWIVGDDGTLRGIDLIQEKEIFHTQLHDGRIKSLIQANGILITCGTDKQVYQWV